MSPSRIIKLSVNEMLVFQMEYIDVNNVAKCSTKKSNATTGKHLIELVKRVDIFEAEYLRCKVYRDRDAFYCGASSQMSGLKSIEFGLVPISAELCREMYKDGEFKVHINDKTAHKLKKDGTTHFDYEYIGYEYYFSKLASTKKS